MVTKPLSMSRVAILAIVAVALSPARPSRAAEPSPHLYQSATIVTGQELPNRSTAARIALPRVLVKISGDPSVALDRRLKPYANQAIDLVAGFTYRDQMAGIPVRDEQGTPDRTGRYSVFEHGSIYWKATSAPHAIQRRWLPATYPRNRPSRSFEFLAVSRWLASSRRVVD